jgi:hypothetical protein
MELREELMRTKVLHEKLSRVEVKLAAATESLIGMQPGSGPSERAALMSEAAALLQDLDREIHVQQIHVQQTHASSLLSGCRAVRTDGRAPDSSAIEPRTASLLAADGAKAEILRVLHGIQERASQLGELNDAALSLCRGWLSVQPAPVEDYTPGGVWSAVREPAGPQTRA